MQTEKTVFLDLLGMPATRFVIPAYQRLYSWRERQCRELWLDLHRAARADATHFIGTLLYSHEDPDADGRQRLAVIDGQQRLTTMTLLIEALRRHLEEILAANAEDLAAMDPASPLCDRLRLTPERLETMAADMESVAGLPSPQGERPRGDNPPPPSEPGGYTSDPDAFTDVDDELPF